MERVEKYLMLLLTIKYFAASLDFSLHGEPVFLRVNPHSKPTQAKGKACMGVKGC